MSDPVRSVKIDPNERGGWTSDRPRREGEPERPPRKIDVSTRCRVLAPTDRIVYRPGSLLLVVGPDAAARDALVERVVEETAAILTHTKLRELLTGRVADEELDAKAEALRDAYAARRFQSGDSVVISVEGLDPEERERWVRLAHGHKRPRHLLLVEPAGAAADDATKAALGELRTALDAGQLGQEGFVTAMRLSGKAAGERRRVVFVPASED